MWFCKEKCKHDWEMLGCVESYVSYVTELDEKGYVILIKCTKCGKEKGDFYSSTCHRSLNPFYVRACLNHKEKDENLIVKIG